MKYLLFVIMLFFAVNLPAQTTIETQTRPELSLKEGIFGPKFYVDGQKANKWHFTHQINQDERAGRLMKRGANLRGWGYGAAGLGAVFLIFEGDRRIDDTIIGRGGDNISNMVLYASWGCIIGGAAMYYRGHAWQKRAVALYNSDEGQSTFRLGPTRDGLGLSLNF